MILFVLAYLGEVLTIISPCILPVLAFVFTHAGQPFLRSVLPMLLGMAATFALVATLAADGAVAATARVARLAMTADCGTHRNMGCGCARCQGRACGQSFRYGM